MSDEMRAFRNAVLRLIVYALLIGLISVYLSHFGHLDLHSQYVVIDIRVRMGHTGTFRINVTN